MYLLCLLRRFYFNLLYTCKAEHSLQVISECIYPISLRTISLLKSLVYPYASNSELSVEPNVVMNFISDRSASRLKVQGKLSSIFKIMEGIGECRNELNQFK